MAKFLLKAGMHVQADPDAKPVETLDTQGHPVKDLRTGKAVTRVPSRTYRVGETVENDMDLVSRFGPEKFQLVEGTPKEDQDIPPHLAVVAPGGQVQSGFQATRAGVPGAISEADLADIEPQDKSMHEGKARQRKAPKSFGDAAKAQHEARTRAADETPHHTPGQLEDMSVHELRALADEQDIELGSARTKDDVIKAIQRGERKAARS